MTPMTLLVVVLLLGLLLGLPVFMLRTLIHNTPLRAPYVARMEYWRTEGADREETREAHAKRTSMQPGHHHCPPLRAPALGCVQLKNGERQAKTQASPPKWHARPNWELRLLPTYAAEEVYQRQDRSKRRIRSLTK